MTILLAVLFSVGLCPVEASEKGQLQEFLSVEGNLSADTQRDKVSLLSPCGECYDWEENSEPTLRLKVEIIQPRKKTLVLEAPKALCFRCGGAKGAAIVGRPEISKKGVLEIEYAGGSREYWSHLLKWKFNEATNKLELIGYTSSIVDTLKEDKDDYSDEHIGRLISTDINYRTRKIEKTVVGKNLKPKLLKCSLPASHKAPAFETFNYAEFNSGDDDCT